MCLHCFSVQSPVSLIAFLRQIRNPRKINVFFVVFKPLWYSPVKVHDCFWTKVQESVSSCQLSCCVVLSFEEQWHVCHQWLLHVWYVVHSKIPSKSENTMPIILPPLSCVWNILGFSKLWCCHWMECCFVPGFHWWFHVSTFVTVTKMNVPRYVDEIQNCLYKIESYIGSNKSFMLGTELHSVT